MSAHYTASQFNEPFWPKRLRNWRLGVNPWPGFHAGCPRRCPTTFIADDDGHLFPHIYRNGCTSPWGDYRTSIWEETIPCCCVDQVRNPQDYRRPRPVILVGNQLPCPKSEAKEVCQIFNNSTEANTSQSQQEVQSDSAIISTCND